MNDKNIKNIWRAKIHIRTIQLLLAVVVFIFAVMTLNSCVKDKLHNTPHPNRGVVYVHTDWSDLFDDTEAPKSYLLRVNELTHEVSGSDNSFNTLLSEGSYTLLVHNMPHGVTVGNTTATVNTLADGTLEPQPEFLFSAKEEFQIVKDDTAKVHLKMIQSIRILQLVLDLSAEDAALISSTTATLTGISSEIDLATGATEVTKAGKTVKPSFTFNPISSAQAKTTPTLTTTLRLAGRSLIDKQILTLVVTLKNGSIQTIATDLTTELRFFTDIIDAMELRVRFKLKEDAQSEMEVNDSIKDWDLVDNGNFPVH